MDRGPGTFRTVAPKNARHFEISLHTCFLVLDTTLRLFAAITPTVLIETWPSGGPLHTLPILPLLVVAVLDNDAARSSHRSRGQAVERQVDDIE